MKVLDGSQSDLFVQVPVEEIPPPAAVEELSRIDPDNLTPREALDALYRLKKLL
jgi:DNA mismatch repair protein MutS